MNHDDLLPEWDRGDHSRRAALDARLCDMIAQHLDDDPRWPRTVTNLAADLVEHDEVLAMLSRVCVAIENFALYCHGGRAEAVASFVAQRAQLRAIAMKGAAQ